jgi:putative phosphoribosyl transferase
VDIIEEATAVYRDRTDAGQQLARALAHIKAEAPVVVALPRGGVPVAYEVAKALEAPLDLALVRKIGAPGQPELAIGAVVDGENLHVFVNRDVAALFQESERYIEEETQKKIQEIEDRRRRYFGGRSRPSLKGRTVILVDDGIATGATMRAAIEGLQQSGVARLIVAVPVGPPDTIAKLRTEVDDVICLETSLFFSAVGQFYEDFSQTTDDEVVEFLHLAAA